MGLIFVRWSSDMHVAHWFTLGGVHSTLACPTRLPHLFTRCGTGVAALYAGTGGMEGREAQSGR